MGCTRNRVKRWRVSVKKDIHHISTRCTCNGVWGDCDLDLLDDGKEWENLGENRGSYTFKSKKHHVHVAADHVEGNWYAVNSVWS